MDHVTVLDYGRPDPPLRRWWRLVPRLAPRTLAIMLIAVLSTWWFWTTRHPWQIQRSFPSGYASLGEKISPDYTKLITASARGVMGIGDPIVWHIPTGRKLFSLVGHKQRVQWASFSRDGSRILTEDIRRSMNIWDGNDGNLIQNLDSPLLISGSLAIPRQAFFSPDGRRVVVQGHDIAVLVDSTTGANVADLPKYPFYSFQSVVFSPDSQFFCIGPAARSIRSTETGKEISPLSPRLLGAGASPTFSPDSLSLAAASGDTVCLYAARTGATRWQTPPFHEIIRSLTFSPDGRRLLVVHDGLNTCSLTAFDPADGKRLATVPISTPTPRMQFTGGGKFLLVYGRDGSTQVVDAELRPVNALTRLRFGYSSPVSPDGSRVALLQPFNQPLSYVELRNPTLTRVFSRLLPTHPTSGRFNDVCFLGDSNRLATVNDAGDVELWRRRRPEPAWGIVALPQFWLALASVPAALWSIARDLRKQYGSHIMPA